MLHAFGGLDMKKQGIARSKIAGRLAAVLLAGTCLSSPAWATDFTVNNAADSGPGSLRQAIIDSNAAGGTNRIIIATGLTITLTSGDLPTIKANVTIQGNNATLSGNNQFRGLFIGGFSGSTQTGVTVAVQDLAITNTTAAGGNATGGDGGGAGAGLGGAIFVANHANVTVSNVSLTNNAANGGNGDSGANGGGGGGGMGGQGGQLAGNGRGGGGGLGVGANGGNGTSNGQSGIGTGAAAGGSVPGGGAGGASGGGGGGSVPFGNFAAGGGVGGGSGSGGNGGAGGFGGGGGFGTTGGGGGGFGGGGGAAGGTGGAGGQGGFGGGNGVASATAGGGGAGAGMGGAVFVQQGGNLNLSGPLTVNGNSVTGGTGQNGGGNGSAFGSGLFLQGNGTVTFSPGASQSQTVSNVIADQTGSSGTGGNAGSYSLSKTGAGTTTLSAANTYSGGTTLTAGTLAVGNNSALGTGTLAFANGTTLQAAAAVSLGNAMTLSGSATINNNGNALTIGGAIGGTGGFTATGAGTTTLTSTNTYSGPTSVAAGSTLQTNAPNALGSSSALTVSGTVNLNGNNQTVGALAGTATGVVDLQGANLTAGGANTNTNYSGIIQDGVGGGVLTKVGTGTLTLSGANTFAGGIALTAGTLGVGSNAALGTGTLAFANATTLQAVAAVSLGNAMTLSGNNTVDDQGNALSLTGVISGGGILTKIGGGTLTLTGNNNYSGGTTVTAGTLAVGNNIALGTFTVLLADGTALQAAANGLTIGNAINLGAGSIGATIDTQANSLMLTGSILGPNSLTNTGTGTLSFNSNNAAYTGATTVAAGTLALVGGANISNSSVLTVSTGATFDVSNNSAFNVVNTLAGGGTVQLGSNGLFINNASTEFSGAIAGSGGVEIRSGTQTFSGVNSYTNETQIDGGATLALKGNGSIASSAVVGFASSPATLDISQTNAGATVGALFDNAGNGIISLGSKTLTVANGGTFNGVIQDGGIAGGIGGGLTVAGNELDLGGVNTYTGPTTIMAGAILALISPGTIATSSGVNLVGASATFDISGSGTGQTIKGLAGVAGSTVALGGFALTVGSANSTTFAGTITDGGLSGGTGGSLVKVGSGTLALSGNNTYTGGTTINGGLINFAALNNFGTGMVTLNGGGVQWASGSTADISSQLAPLGAAGGTFDTNGNNVTLASTISGAGARTKQGLGTLTLAANNTYAGGTTVTGGLINFNAASNFGSGMITLAGGGLQWAAGSTADISAKLAPLGAAGGTFDTNGNTIAFATALTGTGGLTKQGLGKLNLIANNTYSGPTSVMAGTLSVNGSITSNVTVGSAGTLGGNGTIFGSVVNAGALAPGNSIGLLTVNGTYTQAAGSTYQVEVNAAGQGDRLNVTGAPGTATLQGGTVQVLAAAGSYANSTTYTILNATGGVTGTYAGVTSNFAFLTPSLSYTANNVFLTLALGQTAFTPTFLALTPNQKAVGTALNQSFANASGDFATVIGALAGLNTAQGPMALDTISGQPYADFGTMNTNNAAMFMNALGQQMAGFHGGQPAGQHVALAQACEIESCDGTGPLSAWASALGGLGSILGDGNASTLTYNFGGAAAGLDYRFDPRFLAGIGVGYTHGTEWVNSFMGQGWSDSVSVAAYGSFTQAGFYVDALAGYAYYSNQLQRQILIPGLQQRTATGSTGANQFLGQAEGGYKVGIYAPAAATITPFGRFQISSVTQNAFSESGAQSLSLNVAQQTTNSQRTTIGADLGSSIGLGNERKLDLAVRLGWMHEFADVARPITAAFAGAPGNSFTVFGATPLRNSAVVGLQATTNIAQATQIYLRYDGEIASGTDNHALNIGLRMSW